MKDELVKIVEIIKEAQKCNCLLVESQPTLLAIPCYRGWRFKNNKFMYEKEIKEKGYDMPTKGHQPELNVIIERLQKAVTRYDDIVCETRSKLKMIKKYEEPSKLDETLKEIQPESAMEEINRLLSRFNDLNDTAERNLRHLGEIV